MIALLFEVILIYYQKYFYNWFQFAWKLQFNNKHPKILILKE